MAVHPLHIYSAARLIEAEMYHNITEYSNGVAKGQRCTGSARSLPHGTPPTIPAFNPASIAHHVVVLVCSFILYEFRIPTA